MNFITNFIVLELKTVKPFRLCTCSVSAVDLLYLLLLLFLLLLLLFCVALHRF